MTTLRSAAVIAAGLLATASLPAQNLLTNGDFETGDFTGWVVTADVAINDGTLVIPGNGTTEPPIGGMFDSLTTGGGPGLRSWSNSFVVPAGVTTAFATWTDTIRNFATMFSDPNQEFRVFLADSSGMQVGPTLFSTNPGDQLVQLPTTRFADVTATLQANTGATLSLVFEEEDSLFFFNCSLDDVGIFVNQAGNPATTTEFGAGCPNGGAIYELFPGGTEDVAGSTITFTPTPGGTGYTVTQGGPAMDTPANATPFGDDDVQNAFPLGFAFNYPGGSTTDVDVSSNGYIYLQTGTIGDSRCCAGDPNRFVNEDASIAIFGTDLNPSAGGQMFIDNFPGRFTVTWQGVPNFGAANMVDAQVQLYADGRIVLIYGASTIGAGQDTIIGVSPGMSADPGSQDLTSLNGQTFGTLGPLGVSRGGPRPTLGSVFQWNVDGIPGSAIAGAVLLGFSPVTVDLSPLGAPGCALRSSGLSAVNFVVGAPTSSATLNIPAFPSLDGVSLETQAVVVAPGVNALNVITSNGLRLTVGSF